MLENSKNFNIEKAYLKILENENSEHKEYAYHCTNINPMAIIKNGFHSTEGNGYTEDNAFKSLYLKYLPSNPCFVSKKPWDENSKYIIKIDITGLEKYPDFGHLVDTGAYYEEMESPEDILFYWEDKDLQYPSKYMPIKLLSFLVSKPEEERGILNSKDFDGKLSFDLVGTCAIDGDELTPDRIEIVKSYGMNESSNENENKNWAMIRNANKKREEERQKQLVPAEFSASMKFDKNYGAISLTGSTKEKIVNEANSAKNGIEGMNTELHISDDGKSLLFDITIYTSKEWDSEPINKIISYFANYAPWISSHIGKKIVEQQISFLRYDIKDEMVLNRARQLVGRDKERTDFVQMELF